MIFSLCACSSNNTEENQDSETNTNIITEETEFYRSIMVADYKGSVDIKRNEGDELSAYEGLSLNDGDEVKVNDHSDLTLNVDSDKHLYADENTHFWITASGSEGNTKTKIKLEKGSVLCQIKNKLLENEFFEIETASSTMSVRGTVYRVTVIKGLKDDEVYELIEVFDGGVATVINEDGQSVELKPGQAALIKEKDDGSDARFVKDDEIDEEFWLSSDMGFNIETEDGNGSPILEISYEKLSEGVLEKLTEIVEEGQVVIIEKEVLEEVQETGHNYEVVSRIEPTCTKDCLVVSKCTICNQETEEVLPKLSHNYVKVSESQATCTSSGLVVYRCSNCSDEKTETIAMLSHNYVQTAHKDPTCTENGYTAFKCTRCDDTYTTTIAKLGHDYKKVEEKSFDSTCITDGVAEYICSRCNGSKSETIPAKGHTMEVISIEPDTTQAVMLAEVEITTEKLPPYIKGMPVKYSDGKEEVILSVTGTQDCTSCYKQQSPFIDDCYLVYGVNEEENIKTRTLDLIRFNTLGTISITDEALNNFRNSVESTVIKLLSTIFDHAHTYNIVSDVHWNEENNEQRILDYTIGGSGESRTLTLNNVETSCKCGAKNKELINVNISLIEGYDENTSKDTLTYEPLDGFTLSADVESTLNNFFLHDYTETVSNVVKSKDNTNNDIKVNITYSCAYHDCIFTRHADRIVENQQATVNNNEIIWDKDEQSNETVTQQPVVNSWVRKLYESLFGSQSQDYTYSYTLYGNVANTHIRRNWNGDISVGYLFKVEETKTKDEKDEEVIKNIYPIYAVYVLEDNGEGEWSIMSPLQIQNSDNLMKQLQGIANADISAYKKQ